MNLKKLPYRLFAGVGILCLFISCNTGNRVVSSFGKRKYTKGYYFNIHSTPERVSKSVAVLYKPVSNRVSAHDLSITGKLAELSLKNTTKNTGEQPSAKPTTLTSLFPQITAVRQVLKNANPLQNMPADTSQAKISPTDYRKYNEEAISGFAIAVAMVCLCWTGYGLLLAIPGFLLCLWGTQSQKFYKISKIGLLINLVGLAALVFLLSYQLLLLASGN